MSAIDGYICNACETHLDRGYICMCRQPIAGLGARLVRARRLHPEGASLGAIVSEVGELAWAILFEHHDRVKEESWDVAVVAIRYALGERQGAR